MDFQIKLITTITFTQYSLYSDIFRFILQCMFPQDFIFVYEDVDITRLNVHIRVPVIQVLVLVGVNIIIVPFITYTISCVQLRISGVHDVRTVRKE